MEHVDVRGPWPIYVNGSRAYKLEGCDRNITIEQARKVVEGIEEAQERARPKHMKQGG